MATRVSLRCFAAVALAAAAVTVAAPSCGADSAGAGSPPARAGMPKSADFVQRASDPRASDPKAGIDAAYAVLVTLTNGDLLTFGGFSHDDRANNAVVTYNPVTNVWTHRTRDAPVPQKPGGDRTLDLRGLPFFC